ncbi:hypothetical protein GON26_13325 [Flavobacterium sp. GA093]|uniref:Outer membrane protein beta-barrel domain-containing protein n=1 Tax=Flavobacterium hydrocarbonoxydans TaxID=2683249 RepID=A0A6I4NWC9_9FLAO|nr:hypothetical protein [Flavobacterium hydrocarbonoxydans]MWB95344.1 hypothetical protein [Flavobacterium hydrocarbonoxydans]
MLNCKLPSKKLLFPIILLGFASFFSNKTLAQENTSEETFRPHHQLGIAINHVHIFEGRDEENKKKALTLPSWAIDYTYHFSEKWAVGLHTDIVIEKFKVEKNLEGGEEKETVERSYPIAPAVMGIYKFNEHWSFLLGMGGEFAKEENFALTRIGAEYGHEISDGWEVFGTFSYDVKWSAYDSWGLGLGIAKSFGDK